ncbi:S9 family peptidase [Thermicanus aegyptius]|uniref:S9 family peptidase n=1 Tax=Thermicanus aegyptius TaxID=94009 RepID=UPI0004184F65|nr:S9 family peptidase [Thermicanus aegyptius]
MRSTTEEKKKRGMVPEDLLKMAWIRDPRFSPDGKRVLYTVKTINEEGEYQSNLFMLNVETGEDSPWTYGKGIDASPRWSPDGQSITFLSNRSGKMQVWLISSEGGEARPLTRFTNGVNQHLFSPDGRFVAVLVSLKPDEPGLLANTPPREEKDAKEKKEDKPMIVDRLKYKSDDFGFRDEKLQYLYLVDVKTGESKRLTEGDESISSFTWAPDGKRIAFTANRASDPDRTWTNDLFILDMDTLHVSKLTDQDGVFGSLAWSPDGKWIAALGHNLEYAGATLTKVWLFDPLTGEKRGLTENWDVDVEDEMIGDMHADAPAPGLVWATDGRGLYFRASREGNVSLFYTTLEGMITPVADGTFHIYGFSLDETHQRAVLAVSRPTEIGDLYLLRLSTGEWKRLTNKNEELMSQLTLSTPEEFRFDAKDGWIIQGWLMKPVDFKPEEKYPLILEIHGGPHAMYGNTFFHEMQVLAAKGYAVLYTNPRGSHGYGQTFVHAVCGDYGGMDYEDLMAGVDEALRRFTFIDKDRLGVTGGSYGGFMTNWIVGHTNRFKAAVTQRSISNWMSFYGVSDIGYFFTEWEIGFPLFDHPEKLWEHSPLKYVKNMETPLLILHSERDYRCPIEQGEQLYVALKHLNKVTRFVRFPDSNHNLSRTGKPSLRIERLHHIVDWFGKYM